MWSAIGCYDLAAIGSANAMCMQANNSVCQVYALGFVSKPDSSTVLVSACVLYVYVKCTLREKPANVWYAASQKFHSFVLY